MSDISDQGLRPPHVQRGADYPTEPSTEKEPGEEPKAPQKDDAEPSHEAVGIGVVGRPQTEPDPGDDTEPGAADARDEERTS